MTRGKLPYSLFQHAKVNGSHCRPMPKRPDAMRCDKKREGGVNPKDQHRHRHRHRHLHGERHFRGRGGRSAELASPSSSRLSISIPLNGGPSNCYLNLLPSFLPSFLPYLRAVSLTTREVNDFER